MRSTTPSLVAGGDIYPCRFVKISSAANYKGLQATANDVLIGVSHEGTNYPPLSDQSVSTKHAKSGQPIGMYGEGDECLLEIGDTVVRGNRLKADTNGKGVPILTTGTTIQNVGAIAQESGSSGERIRVQVRFESVRPATS